jgi:hypothetical protein
MTLVLCLWLLAFASHAHGLDDAGPGTGETGSACSFCLSFPTGAAAPVVQTIAAPLLVVAGLVTPVIDAVDAQDVPSFYSSRAPPSR